jgi:hypothetical protein
MVRSNKKAQITLFVIIGLVLLILVIIILLISRYRKTGPGTEPGSQPILTISPVENYVKQCLYLVGKDGVQKLGAHGGYIYPERFGIISNAAMPTESTGVSIFPDSEVVPYWFYMKSPNKCLTNCIVTSEQPPLTKDKGAISVESQLADYIEEHIGFCLNNLSKFSEDNGIKSEIIGSPKVEVYIKDSSVLLTLKQTLKVSYEDQTKTFESFQEELPVRLKDAYHLMERIIDYSRDADSRSFEMATQTIVGTFGMGKNPEIPPMGGGIEMFFARMPPQWSFQSTKSFVQSRLEDSIPLISVDGTRNSQVLITSDPYFNGIYNNFVLSIPYMSNPEDYSVDFLYMLNWPAYMDIQPREGDVIITDVINPFFGLIRFQTSEYFYDLSYPIIIIIKDYEAFGQEGFTFQAALEVNLRANEPLNISGESPTITGEALSLFCDYAQRKTGTINIITTTPEPPVPTDVIISYECGDEACFIGSTGDDGYLNSKLPLCTDGLVTANVDNYFSTAAQLSTSKDMEKTVYLNLEPYKEITVEMKKAVMTKIGLLEAAVWAYDPSKIMDLGLDDKGTIILSREQGLGESPVMASVEINGKELGEPKTIKLVPGTYSFKGFIATHLGPESESKREISFASPDNGEPISMGELFWSGELTFDDTTSGFITITPEDIATGKVTFIIPYADASDILVLEDTITYADALAQMPQTNRADLLPRFG